MHRTCQPTTIGDYPISSLITRIGSRVPRGFVHLPPVLGAIRHVADFKAVEVDCPCLRTLGLQIDANAGIIEGAVIRRQRLHSATVEEIVLERVTGMPGAINILLDLHAQDDIGCAARRNTDVWIIVAQPLQTDNIRSADPNIDRERKVRLCPVRIRIDGKPRNLPIKRGVIKLDLRLREPQGTCWFEDVRNRRIRTRRPHIHAGGSLDLQPVFKRVQVNRSNARIGDILNQADVAKTGLREIGVDGVSLHRGSHRCQ